MTQSSFADPCTYLTASGGNPAGFDSGLQAGKQFSIKITNDQERKQTSVIFFFWLLHNHYTWQPSGSFARIRSTVASEWSGKRVSNQNLMYVMYRRRFRSSINAPSTGNTYATFLASAKAIGSSEPAVGCSLVPQVSHPLIASNHLQVSDSGPVTGGVGAVASGTPSPIAATSSSSSAASKPSSSNSSSASHLVANSFFALLATAFGIILA